MCWQCCQPGINEFRGCFECGVNRFHVFKGQHVLFSWVMGSILFSWVMNGDDFPTVTVGSTAPRLQGIFSPFSARVAALFVKHTKTGNPLVDSVAEHQPGSADAYWNYLGNLEKECFHWVEIPLFFWYYSIL